MNVITILKQVPDLVEELELNSEGTGLNREWLKFILSEYDDHTLEQALLFKEQYGGTVKAFALDIGNVDDTLFNAAAKGADTLVKVTGNFQEVLNSHTTARIFQQLLSNQTFDLLLTGVQAIDDHDGSVGPLLAGYLGFPYVGVVRGVRLSDDKKSVIVGKEYPGGIISEIRVTLPAVLGIQAASKPPRYVPIAKIRQAQKNAKIEEVSATETVGATACDGGRLCGSVKVIKMFKPESTTKAEMLEGNTDEIAARIASLLMEKGIVR